MAPVSLRRSAPQESTPYAQNPDIRFGPSPITKGDTEAALALYQRSVNIKRTASSLFNLGVAQYHLSTLTFSHDQSKSMRAPLMMFGS